MARRNASQGTPATAALTAAGVPFVLHPYTHDPTAASYGAEAAEALGIDPSRVFKTLMVEVEGRLAVGIVPVSGTLDLKALATALGAKKAAMADPAAAQRRSCARGTGRAPTPSPACTDSASRGAAAGGSVPGCLLGTPVVGLDDARHHRMAHHVSAREVRERDALDLGEHLARVDQA